MNQGTSQLYDIYDMPYEPQAQQPWLYLLVAALIVIFGVITWLSMQSLKKDLMTPAQRALARLKMIDPDEVSTQEQQKQFYSTVSSILKEFFVHQCTYGIVGMTDEEFKQFLARVQCPLMICQDIAELFEGVEYIKFAGQEAVKKKIIHDYERVKRIIEQTSSSMVAQAGGEGA